MMPAGVFYNELPVKRGAGADLRAPSVGGVAQRGLSLRGVAAIAKQGGVDTPMSRHSPVPVKMPKKVAAVMHEFKEGTLRSGSKKGPKVKGRKQAVAIALSEARQAGAKIPKKKKGY